MSTDSILTFYGHVGTPVELREGAVPWFVFRAGTTPSYFDQATRTWRDLETTWISIKAWKNLAMNAAEALQVGDPIIAIGKVRTQTWTTHEGEQRESTVLEASLIAHDLTRGVTTFRRVERQQAPASGGDGTAEALAELETRAAGSPAA